MRNAGVIAPKYGLANQGEASRIAGTLYRKVSRNQRDGMAPFIDLFRDLIGGAVRLNSPRRKGRAAYLASLFPTK
jgi:hypothetical protein